MLAVLCAVAQNGCGCGDDEDDHPRRVEAVIGAAGGEMTSGDERLWLIIPPRAVDADRTFFIEQSGQEPPEGAVALPYDIGIVGQDEVELHEPATIVFYYDLEDLGDRSPLALRGATQAAGLAWSCITESAVGAEDHSLVLSTTHLSTWAARYEPCEPSCTAPETCVGVGADGFCAIPCTDSGQCPFPMSCKDIGVCAYDKCYLAGGVECTDTANTTCSNPDSVGVCLPHCSDPGSGCGASGGGDDGQHTCSEAMHCSLTNECPDPIDCGVDACLHGACLPLDVGCDCDADPDCPCYDGGGGDGDADADGDIAGEWNYRYSCASQKTGQCFEDGVCSTMTFVAGAGPADWTDDSGGLTGHLDGDVMTWVLHDDDGGAFYTEVGTFTFSPDHQSFTQESCYAYDGSGTADPDTLICSGATSGECTGAGSRATPDVPARVGSCNPGPDCP